MCGTLPSRHPYTLKRVVARLGDKVSFMLTLNLPTTTVVAQPFNIIKWQVKFNPVA